MAARSIWSGTLQLGLVAAAVKLYKATEEAHTGLRQLNPKTGNPLTQRMVDSATGEAVDRGDIVKGYEFAPERFVIVTRDDLDGLAVESSKTLAIKGFIDANSIDPIYRGDAYFLAPDGPAAEEVYRTLRAAMASARKAALSSVVLWGRERQVLVEPYGAKGLLLTTLRAAKEVRAESEYLGKVSDAKPQKELLALAKQLIAAHGVEWNAEAFVDRYHDALAALLKAKVEAGSATVTTAKGKAKASAVRAPVLNLVEAMRASIEAPKAKPGRKAKALAVVETEAVAA